MRPSNLSQLPNPLPLLSIAIAKPGVPEATSQLCAMPVIQGIIYADRPGQGTLISDCMHTA